MSISADQQDEARFQQRTAAQYHEWIGYLEASLTVLQSQRTAVADEFERTDTSEENLRAAQTQLKAIEPRQRALYDTVVDLERQSIQQDHAQHGASFADPDDVSHQALQDLLDDARGLTREDRRGMMPRGTPTDIKWYAVDVAALSAAPTAEAYTAANVDRQAKKRALRNAGLGVLAIIFALIWWLRPHGPSKAANGATTAQANGTALTPWSIVSVSGGTGETIRWSQPIATTAAGTWPQPAENTSQVYWRQGSIAPILLCAPIDLVREIDTLRLISAGDAPERVYSIGEPTNVRADLILEACSSSGGDGVKRAGVLRMAQSRPLHAIGEPIKISEQVTITVTSITITGPGQDTTLPPQQARVAVDVTAAQGVDWPALSPTLLIPNGTSILPSETQNRDGGVTLRYLVPLPDVPLTVAWSVAPGQGQPALRWRTTLEAPPSRSALLQGALVVDAIDARPGSMSDAVAIQLRLTNRGTVPITLAPGEITLSAGVTPLAGIDTTGLQKTILAGGSLSADLSAPTNQGDITLTIGRQRFAITTR